MQEHFIDHVEQAIPLLRRRDVRRLGTSPLAADLPGLIGRDLPGPKDSYSELYVGDALKRVLMDCIELLKPAQLEGDSPEKRAYVYLKRFIVDGKEHESVERELGLGRATVYEVRRRAVDGLALRLWRLEQDARTALADVKHNLPAPIYGRKYIERRDEKGRDYVLNVIIPELRDSRAWVVSLEGDAGVGKSVLAYRVAEECVNQRVQLRLPFEAVIWHRYRPEFSVYARHLATPSDVEALWGETLDAIARTLGKRETLAYEDIERKEELVRQLLRNNLCLLVLDNLESADLPEEFLTKVDDFLRQDMGSTSSKALVTHRTAGREGEHRIRVGLMHEDECRQFMETVAADDGGHGLPITERDQESILKSPCGGSPLAMKTFLGFVHDSRINVAESVCYFPKAATFADMIKFMYQSRFEELPPTAQRMLLVLPLFKAPLSLSILQAAAGLSEAETVNAILSLSRAQMLEISGGQAATQRFDILPLLREFVIGILKNEDSKVSGVTVASVVDDAHRRLARFYLDWIALTPSQNDIVLLLKDQKENIFRVMEWCYSRTEPELRGLVVDFEERLGIPLALLHYLPQKIAWGTRAAEICERSGQEERAEFFRVRDVAWSYVRQGTEESRARAKEMLARSLEIGDRNGWKSVQALVLRNMGRFAIEECNFDKARELLDESLRLWEALDDPRYKTWMVLTRYAQADLLKRQGRWLDAEREYSDLAADIRSIGSLDSALEAESSLSVIKARTGDCENARMLSEETLNRIRRAINSPSTVEAVALRMRAEVEELCGNKESAADFVELAIKMYKDLGMEYEVRALQDQLDSLKT